MAPAASAGRSAVGDLLGLRSERAEVLLRAICRQEAIGRPEPPPGERHRHPSVHPAQLPAARRARAGRWRPHRLELLDRLPAGPASVLVDGHACSWRWRDPAVNATAWKG